MKNGIIKKAMGALTVLIATFGIAVYADNQKEKKIHPDDDNINIFFYPCFDKDGEKCGIYTGYVKRVFDMVLSVAGLVMLSPLFAIIAAVIYVDDPGPVIFKQKRVGKGCSFFYCHKFRSMRTDAPHDVPTHRLSNSDQYITKVGRMLRKTSLDELPQIWDILRGKMSVIGPRPALWNQDDLVAEREKYGANDVMPGLTGLAQIKGRDELEIPEKAKLDGKYTAVLKKGGLRAFFFDAKLFVRTVVSVVKHDGVVEGGTGKPHRSQNRKKKQDTAYVGTVPAGGRQEITDQWKSGSE